MKALLLEEKLNTFLQKCILLKFFRSENVKLKKSYINVPAKTFFLSNLYFLSKKKEKNLFFNNFKKLFALLL